MIEETSNISTHLDFMNELVHIQFMIGGRIPKECSWKITRHRLTIPFLKELIHRVSLSGKVSQNIESMALLYLQSINDGEIIFFDHMQRFCKTLPFAYVIVLAVPKKVHDFRPPHGTYVGSKKLLVRKVPNLSQNKLYSVNNTHVRSWIIRGILTEESSMKEIHRKMEKTMDNIQKITDFMKRLPNIPMTDAHGHQYTGERADKMREEKYNALKAEKHRMRIDYQTMLEEQNKLICSHLQSLDISVSLAYLDDITQSSTWIVQFTGAHKKYYENLAMLKESWEVTYMLANTSDNNGSEGLFCFPKNFSKYLVNLSGIELESVADGCGSYFANAERKMKSCDVHFYHGSYSMGVRNGVGLLSTSSSIFIGEIVGDDPCGDGVEIWSVGDVINGRFSIPLTELRESRLGCNPYVKNRIREHAKIFFSDGSFYDGVLIDNCVTGLGVYTNSKGDRVEGVFFRGELTHGCVTKSNGDVSRGKFKNGFLHGPALDQGQFYRYEGHFVDGKKHGKGSDSCISSKSSRKISFNGYFQNGERYGHGVMRFHDPTLHSEFVTDGPWHAGRPRNGGRTVVAMIKSSLPTTAALSCDNRREACLLTHKWAQWLSEITRKDKARRGKVHEIEAHVMRLTQKRFFHLQSNKRKEFACWGTRLLETISSVDLTTIRANESNAIYQNNDTSIQQMMISKDRSPNNFNVNCCTGLYEDLIKPSLIRWKKSMNGPTITNGTIFFETSLWELLVGWQKIEEHYRS